MGEIIKLTFVLVIISMIAGLAAAVTNGKTSEKIAMQKLLAEKAAIEAVFPQGVLIAEHNGEGNLPEKYWSASKDGEVLGYAFRISGAGYGGDIGFMVSSDLDGKILGMTILHHNETPGLGSRVTEVASNKYIWYPISTSEKAKPWFTEQFENLSCLKSINIDRTSGEWHKLDGQTREALRDKNAVTAITGSTISTKAITKGIEQKAAVYINALIGTRELEESN